MTLPFLDFPRRRQGAVRQSIERIMQEVYIAIQPPRYMRSITAVQYSMKKKIRRGVSYLEKGEELVYDVCGEMRGMSTYVSMSKLWPSAEEPTIKRRGIQCVDAKDSDW